MQKLAATSKINDIDTTTAFVSQMSDLKVFYKPSDFKTKFSQRVRL